MRIQGLPCWALTASLWVILSPAVRSADADSFYKRSAIFSTRPNEHVSLQTINRFGPVGMAIDLVQPAFTMKINSIEEGSPAAKTGQLKAGQFIDSINGQILADIDPRMQLATFIEQSEAKDGNMVFVVRDKQDAPPMTVTVQLPVLGAFSDTWPINCPKSDAIIRNFATYLAHSEWAGPCELNGPAMMFLLSTGDEKDLDVVRSWITTTLAFYTDNPAPFKNWRLGYGGVPLAEYYLRTGDKRILPVIQKYADQARDHHYLGGWAHGGTGLFPYMGGGHMNAAGTHVLAFLLLAKECGVAVDDITLQSSLKQFYRFAGRGLTPYGDGFPEEGYVDNGRCGKLALSMAAAASLTPNGEDSLYARARDAAALKSFYTTPYMNHGHTGGGVGEVWRSLAMGYLYETRPEQYRNFMNNRKWFYELSRRFNGSFGILGGGRYDGRKGTTPEWGHTVGLTFTVPRKTLQITGAPNTPYCTSYQLPARPWGNAADDQFFSLDACTDRNGKRAAVETEKIEEDSAFVVLETLGQDTVSNDALRRYAHHQDTAFRKASAQRIAGIIPQYMRVRKPEKPPVPELLIELLKSNDPRVRLTGIKAISMAPDTLLTDASFALLGAIVEAPDESFFVAAHALQVMQHGKPEQVANHLDRILVFLESDDWWLRTSALSALMPISTDTRYYAKIYPVLARMIAANVRFNTLRPLSTLTAKLQTADPEVQAAAVDMFGTAYSQFSYKSIAQQEVPNLEGEKRLLDQLAQYLAACPGGLEKLLELSQKRFPGIALSHRKEFLSRRQQVSAVIQKALKPIVLNELIPEHVGKNFNTLVRHTKAQVQSNFAGGRNDCMDQLVKLYQQAGVTGYDWHLFGPNLREASWWYHTFDPIAKEQVPWDQNVVRFRNVTMPKGMKAWSAKDFDAEQAGWKQGKSAFGQFKGEIPVGLWTCNGPGCYCGATINTLWDKEVLMFRGTVKLPELKEGFRYRLRVNDGDHVGTGGGYQVFINGKRFANCTGVPRRGQGGLPKGAFITDKWMSELSAKEATIAVISFIRYNRSYQNKPAKKEPQGRISIHFEEMKIPPFSHDMVVKSASITAMKTSEWQAKQFDGLNQEGGDDKMAEQEGVAADGKFRFDGTFLPNPAIIGAWKRIAFVKEINDFVPGTTSDINHRTSINAMTFKEGGQTDDPMMLWSKDILMNLGAFEALKIKPKTIDGNDYLFIQAGGFRSATGTPIGYMPPWCVLVKKTN